MNGEVDVELDEEVVFDVDYECSNEGSAGGIDEGPVGDEGHVGGIDEEAASDNVSIDDSDYDEEWHWTTVLPDETMNPIVENINNTTEVEGTVDAHQSSKNHNPTTISEFEVEDGDSSYLDNQVSSEEEWGKKIYPKFKLDDTSVRFKFSQNFSTTDLFKADVKKYALHYRKNLHFKKNESKRIVVKCMKDCPFHLRASKYSVKTIGEWWVTMLHINVILLEKIDSARQNWLLQSL